MATFPNTWDSFVICPGSVFRDDSVFRMFYFGYNSASMQHVQIGTATSTDGVRWIKSPSPLLDTLSSVWDYSIGTRAVLKLGGTYYINASDASAGGLIVEELDIAKFPGKVRFSFRNGLSYKA